MPAIIALVFVSGVLLGFFVEFAARWAAWREIELAQDLALKALKQAAAAQKAADIILHDVIERVVSPEVLDGVIERVVEPERSEP